MHLEHRNGITRSRPPTDSLPPSASELMRADIVRYATTALSSPIMRRPSSLLRLIRAMTAVITVWCIGCSGFEPLLGAVMGTSDAVMTCGSVAGTTSSSRMSSSDEQTGSSSVSAAADGHRGFECGCGSCHSASPSAFVLPSGAGIALHAPFASVDTLVSVIRTPLLPPPQHAA